SSSVGNNIPLTLDPEEMFGRTMRIPDTLLPDWYRLVLESTDDPLVDPWAAKRWLGRRLIARFSGEEAVQRVADAWGSQFRMRALPKDMASRPLPPGDVVPLPALISEAFGLSRSEARRRIAQGSVTVDQEPIDVLDVPRSQLLGRALSVG